MCVAAVVGGLVVGGIGLFGAKQQADRAEDLYDKENAASASAAYANAEYELTAAEARSDAILAGAHAQAGAAIGSAEAEAEAIRIGTAAESDAAAKAAKAARDEAYDNVNLMKQEAEESLRRLENEQNIYEEKAKAKAGASGLTQAGSTGKYLKVMDEENTRQYTWLDKAYTNQRKVEKESADREYQASLAYADAIRTGGYARADATQTSGHLVAGAYMEGAHGEAGAHMKIARAGMAAVTSIYGPQVPTINQRYTSGGSSNTILVQNQRKANDVNALHGK